MDKYIGRLLDERYEILEIIGVGGMAVVYKAMDHRLNRLVAVKILKDDYTNDADLRRRFHNESQAVAMMSHPNIVSVYDVSRNDAVDFIVMELIDGITLKQYMEKKGPLSWRECLHFAMQIGKALEHAHSRNIIHRDIKPHNVMILKDGSVKVADFGIARVASAQNTLTKEALGSVHYISPEQAKGARVDNRTDIYSLGVVMYEMLTGRPPYDGETPVSVAIQHINGTPLAPSLLNSEIPTGLEQITMHAMCSDLNIRYASVTDMLQDMEEFRKDPTIRFTFLPARPSANTAGRVQPLVRPQTVPIREEPKQIEYETDPEDRRRKLLIGAAVGLGVAALLVLIFLVVRFAGRKDSEETSLPSEAAGTTLPAEVRVPGLIGSIYSDVPKDQEPFKYFTFVVDGNSYQYNDAYPDGVIFDQSVSEGQLVAPGTEIYLSISMGERTDNMPDLTRYSLENAQFQLKAMDLNLTVLTEPEYSDEVKENFVIRTDPVAQSTLKEGQVVTIYVSLGRERIEVPNLANYTLADAQQSLKEKDLRYSIVEEYSNSVTPGCVISQSPAPETEVERNSVVTLTVSKGKQMVQVVSVVGMEQTAARAMLEARGLVVNIAWENSETVLSGQVIRQSPGANAEVAPGSVVTLTASAGPAPRPTESDPPAPSEEPSPEPSQEAPDESDAP